MFTSMNDSGKFRCRWQKPLTVAAVLVVAVAVTVSATVAGVAAWVAWRWNQVDRVDVTAVTAPVPSPGRPMNFLLVGTDSAAGLGADDPRRVERENNPAHEEILADVIVIARVDPREDGSVRLLSLNRDLWVRIPGHGPAKLNRAFALGGPELLIRTLDANFGVGVHHYVAVDFAGFEQLVEAVGWVPIRFDRPVRDTSTGLTVDQPGCVRLRPAEALAYVRSRKMEVFANGRWVDDGGYDVARTQRQQEFLRSATRRGLAAAARNPLAADRLLNAAADTVTLDNELGIREVWALFDRLRGIDPAQMRAWNLDAILDTSADGQSILRMLPTAANQARLDIFAGRPGRRGDRSAFPAAR